MTFIPSSDAAPTLSVRVGRVHEHVPVNNSEDQSTEITSAYYESIFQSLAEINAEFDKRQLVLGGFLYYSLLCPASVVASLHNRAKMQRFGHKNSIKFCSSARRAVAVQLRSSQSTTVGD